MSRKKYLIKMLDFLTGAYARSDIHNAEKDLPPQTNIGKLFSLFAWGMDILDFHGERMRSWDCLENAEGAVLDRYGQNFGVSRDGTSDAFYRLMIYVKMMSQLSGGDIDTLIRAASQLFDIQNNQVELVELFPAKVRLYVNEDDLTPQKMEEAPLISRLMKRLTAAGVGFKIFLRSYRTLPFTVSVFTGSFILTQSKMVPSEVRFCGKGQLGIIQGAFSQSKSALNPPSANLQEANQTVNGLGSFYQSRITLRPVQKE